MAELFPPSLDDEIRCGYACILGALAPAQWQQAAADREIETMTAVLRRLQRIKSEGRN